MPQRVAVFDFDRTLAAAEVSSWIGRADMLNKGFGGAERVAMLTEMLEALEHHVVKCAVCSLNSRDVIKSALDTVGLLRFFGQPQPSR